MIHPITAEVVTCRSCGVFPVVERFSTPPRLRCSACGYSVAGASVIAAVSDWNQCQQPRGPDVPMAAPHNVRMMPGPQRNLVELLESLLAEARAHKIAGLLGVTIAPADDDGNPGPWTWCWTGDFWTSEGIAAIDALAHAYKKSTGAPWGDE